MNWYTILELVLIDQKEIRTNIGLADTLMPSSFDSSMIIYGNDVYS